MKPYKPTHVNAELLADSKSMERYQFVIDNHKKAIALLKTIKPHQHRQGVWIIKEPANVCGTAACALGWVAMTDVIDGLQYTVDVNRNIYSPVINQRRSNWIDTGYKFFGRTTTNNIFSETEYEMPFIIKLMQQRVKDLKLSMADPDRRFL